ncbi:MULTISPECIES: bifunctional DNA primase/polymerase [unclassified Amycolatopsis]|uniref:bifunctional DNA primase/polymerase n=1 Tax=unclassified Amycolatopsis TaxID=2618356 RepID=UPI0023B03648|nr:bifunctional DNA primase/polymerase [Amycolatopsis sp. La24]
MTAVARGSRSRCLAGDHGVALRSLRAAAENYAALGWPVLPGPVCDGLTTWDPVSFERLGGRESTMSPAEATVDRRVVSKWWAVHRQAILAPVGEHFDVVRAPTHLGWRALAAFDGGHPLGPMALSPHGAFFFVEPGTCGDSELASGVEVLSPGDLVVLPPSRVVAGVVWWRISPLERDLLGDGAGILRKLAELSGESA